MKKPHRRFLLFSLITLIIFFCLAEFTLRLVNINPKVDNPFFMLVRVFEYPDYFKKDENLFWRFRENIQEGNDFLVPGSYRTNSIGLRGEDSKKDSAYRIACFGNSCTFGWRLEENETYSTQAEKKLKQKNRDVEIFNCGVPGYSSFQGMRMLQEYLPLLKPKIVTLCYGWNDQWAAAFDIEDKNQQMPKQFILDIQNTLSQSYLYRSVKYLLLSRSEKSREYSYNRESPLYRVSLEDYRENLIAMIKYCQKNNCDVILISAPFADPDPEKDRPIEIYHQLYNQVLVSVGNDLNVPIIDAETDFRNHPEFYDDLSDDYVHYNAKGAEYIASELSNLISIMIEHKESN